MISADVFYTQKNSEKVKISSFQLTNLISFFHFCFGFNVAGVWKSQTRKTFSCLFDWVFRLSLGVDQNKTLKAIKGFDEISADI